MEDQPEHDDGHVEGGAGYAAAVLALPLALVLVASPQPMKLASTGFSAVNVDEKTSDFFAEFFAQQLQQRGIPITTKSAITAVVGLERQRQLLGCSTDSSSCLAELAGALGVEGLVVGSLAKLGGEFVVTLKVVSAKNSSTLVSETGRLADDRALLDWFTRIATRWAPVLLGGAAPAAVASPPPGVEAAPGQARPRGALPWIVAGGGAAMLVGSAVTFRLSKGIEQDLRNGASSLTSAEAASQARTAGESLQGASGVLLVGGAVATAAAVWLFVRPVDQPTASLAPLPGGALVTIGGAL